MIKYLKQRKREREILHEALESIEEDYDNMTPNEYVEAICQLYKALNTNKGLITNFIVCVSSKFKGALKNIHPKNREFTGELMIDNRKMQELLNSLEKEYGEEIKKYERIAKSKL